jgi:hypothetical protein
VGADHGDRHRNHPYHRQAEDGIQRVDAVEAREVQGYKQTK